MTEQIPTSDPSVHSATTVKNTEALIKWQERLSIEGVQSSKETDNEYETLQIFLTERG